MVRPEYLPVLKQTNKQTNKQLIYSNFKSNIIYTLLSAFQYCILLWGINICIRIPTITCSTES